MDETRLAEAIVQALQAGISTRTSAEEAARIKEANDALLRLSKTIDRATKDTGFFSSVIKNQKLPYRDISDELKKLDEQIAKTTKKSEKDNLMWEKSQIAKANFEANAKAATINFTIGLQKASAAMGQIAAGGAGTFVKNLQSGASSIDVAAGIMTAGVDVANSGLQAAAGSASGMGEALMHGGKKAKIFGLGLMAAGTALSFFSENASKLAKFGIEVLSAELKKSVESFQKTNTAGAMFANGVQGMRDASLASGLTLNQFSDVLTRQQNNLSQLGMGVAEGSKRIGSVLARGGKEMQTQLLNLGFGLEEQADLVAETMQRMKGVSGKPFLASDSQVAEQTKKYAENLRTIAAITGEDAKKKLEAIAASNQILALQQELAKASPAQRVAFDQAMAGLTEAEQKNLRDRIVLHGVVQNKEGAIAESQIAGMREKGEALYKLYLQNQLTLDNTNATSIKFRDTINNSALAAKDIGVASYVGAAGVEAQGKIILDLINMNGKVTADAVGAVGTAIAAQKVTTDPLTVSLNEATLAAQKMALDLQSAMDPLIKGYASVTAAMLESIQKTFAEISKEIHDRGGSTGAASAAGGGSTFDRVKAGALSGAADGAEFGAATGATVGMVAGGIAGSAAGPFGTMLGAASGGYTGAGTGGVIGGIIGGIGGAIEGFFTNPKNTRLDGTGKRYGAAAEPSNKILLIHEGERVLNKLETNEYNKGLATPSSIISTANEQARTPFKEFFASLSAAGTSLQTLLSSGANKLSDILNKDINIKVESMMPPGFTDFAPQLKTIFDQMNSAEMSRSNNAEVTKSAIDQLTTIGKSMDQQSLGQNTQLQGIVNQLLDAVKLPNAQFADQSSQIKTSIDQLITAVKLPNGQNTQVADQASLIKTSMDQLTSAVNLPNAQFANQTSDIKSLITQLIGSVNTPNVQFTDQAAQLKSSIDQLTTSVKLPNGQDKQFADQASQIKTSIDQLIGSANLPTAQVATQVGQIKTSIDQLIGSVNTPNAQFTDQAAQLKSSIDSFGNNTKADAAQSTSLMSQMETTMGQLLNFSGTASKQSADQATQFQTLTDKMFNSAMSTNQFDLGSTSIQKTFDQMLALGVSTDKNTSQLLLTNQDSPNQINKSFDSISKSLIVDSNQQLDGALSRMIGELRDKNVQAEKTTQAQPKSLTNEPISAPIGSDQQQLLELVSKQLLAMETSISKTDNLINLLTEGNNNTRQLLNAAY